MARDDTPGLWFKCAQCNRTERWFDPGNDVTRRMVKRQYLDDREEPPGAAWVGNDNGLRAEYRLGAYTCPVHGLIGQPGQVAAAIERYRAAPGSSTRVRLKPFRPSF